MKGRLTYTQHTKAWPTLEILKDGVVEDLNISFDAADGGTYGEFCMTWYEFGGDTDLFGRTKPKTQHVHIESFQDGLGAMLDARVMRVIKKIRRMRHNPSVDEVVALLEAEGAKPSSYHTQHDA